MVKEYISKLQGENEEKILQLNKEREKLENDLSCAQELRAALEAEKLDDTSIFSPRTIDLDVEDKIKEAKDKVYRLQQQIEEVAIRENDALKSREEFQCLQAELEENTDNSRESAVTGTDEGNSAATKEFLQTLYKKIDTSLSLLNGNKNRCRSELRSALSLIRQFENQSDS